jgi:hypothetical protein
LFPEFTLHDYVPLFFTPNPPMLHALSQRKDNIVLDSCVLAFWASV